MANHEKKRKQGVASLESQAEKPFVPKTAKAVAAKASAAALAELASGDPLLEFESTMEALHPNKFGRKEVLGMTKQQAQKFLESEPASSGSSSSGSGLLRASDPKQEQEHLDLALENSKREQAELEREQEDFEEAVESSKYEVSETAYLDERDQQDLNDAIENSLDDAFNGMGGVENPIYVEESQEAISVKDSQEAGENEEF